MWGVTKAVEGPVNEGLGISDLRRFVHDRESRFPIPSLMPLLKPGTRETHRPAFDPSVSFPQLLQRNGLRSPSIRTRAWAGSAVPVVRRKRGACTPPGTRRLSCLHPPSLNYSINFVIRSRRFGHYPSEMHLDNEKDYQEDGRYLRCPG